MTVRPAKKLFLAPGGYYGPASGLGPLEDGPLGEFRPITSGSIRLPASLPEPFLWEIHLSAGREVPAIGISLAGTGAGDDGPVSQARLRAGRRAELTGIAAAEPGRSRALEFLLHPALPGEVQFLGLSLLSLQDVVAANRRVE